MGRKDSEYREQHQKRIEKRGLKRVLDVWALPGRRRVPCEFYLRRQVEARN